MTYTVQILAMEYAGEDQSSTGQTINITAVQGDGNIVISAGSGSNITINSPISPKNSSPIVEDRDSSARQDNESHEHSQNSQLENGVLVPVVPKPFSKPERLNTKSLVTCRRYLDNLSQLSVKGRVIECSSIIAKLLKTKTDPDLQIALRHVASFNAINEGKLKKANRLLREIEAFLPETKNEAEHRLQWYPLKSLAKLREGRYDMGIVFAKEALPLVDTVAPGCMTAWMLINHAWFLTEIAAGQDDEGDRQFLLRKAEKDYQDAIDHADNEHPEQMHYFQLRVPQFAKIGLAFLYLGCRELVDSSRLEISQDVSLDNIRKAKSLIAALDKEEMVCSVSTFLLKMAKACLYYRLGSYQVAYDLAQEGKAFATKQSLGGFVNFADRTVKYLYNYVEDN